MSPPGGEPTASAPSTASETELDAALLAAHSEGDLVRLVTLYSEAALASDRAGDPAGAAFYRTHAYVFALQAGDRRAAELHTALKAAGRDE